MREDGAIKADTTQLRETVITVEGTQQPVLDNPDDAQIFSSYDAGKTTYTIRHNGPVAFTLRFAQEAQANPAHTKPKAENPAPTRYPVDAEKYDRQMEQGRGVIERRGTYAPYSFAQYHKRYEKLRVALAQQTVPPEQVAALAQEEETAREQLVSVEQARSALLQTEQRDDRFDRLLRAVLSPTPYYNSKETKLELKKQVKQARYDALAKQKEIAAALKTYLN